MSIWVYGRKPEDSRQVVIGPFVSEIQAMQSADKLDDGQVFKFRTTNQVEATRQIKAKLFMDTEPGGISKIINRFRHPSTEADPLEGTPREIDLEDDGIHTRNN